MSPITPIEQFISDSLSQQFGRDNPLVAIVGIFLFSTMVFIFRPPFSVAITSVGLMAIVLFGTVLGGDLGLGYSGYVIGGMMLIVALVAYWAWKRSKIAGDYG